MTVRVGITGLGRWGRTLVEAVSGRQSGIRFTRAITRAAPSSDVCTFAERHGLALGRDYEDLLSDPDIDGVVLTTPHSLHAAQAIRAARAGKHVFVEKPMALTAADAALVVHAAREAQVVLAVGHNRRFLPAVHALQARLSASMLGTVLHAEANHSGGSALRYGPQSWRASRSESPAGGLAGMGVHMVDLLVLLLGRVREVHALSHRRAAAVDIDDTTAVLLRFATVSSAYLGTLAATANEWRLQVFGTAGWAEIREESRLETRTTGSPPRCEDYGHVDKEHAELQAFAAAIAGQAPYPVSFDEAVHVIEVFEAIVAAAATGECVEIPGCDVRDEGRQT